MTSSTGPAAEISGWGLPFVTEDGVGMIESNWDLEEPSRISIEIRDASAPYVVSCELESARVIEIRYRARDGERITHRIIRTTNLIGFFERWGRLVEAAARAHAAGDLHTALRITSVVGVDGRSPMEILTELEKILAERRSTARRRRVRGQAADDLLRSVVKQYKDAVKAKDPKPRKTVADRLGYSPEHIGRLLVKARRTDPPLLGPAKRGTAGEEDDHE